MSVLVVAILACKIKVSIFARNEGLVARVTIAVANSTSDRLREVS